MRPADTLSVDRIRQSAQDVAFGSRSRDRRDWRDRRDRHRYRRAAVVAALVIVLAEVGARLAAPHLPSPQEWATPESQHKSDQLSSWVSRHQRTDIVIFGASMADDGINPSVLTAASGGVTAYNASLAGTTLTSLSLWSRAVLPRLHARVMILGLSPVEINGGEANAAAQDRIFAAVDPARRLLGRETVMQRLTRLAGSVSMLVRIRTILRTPSQWFKGRTNGATGFGMVTDPPLSPAGMALTGEHATYGMFLGKPVPEEARRRQITGLFANFSVGRAQLATIVELARRAEASGTRVVIAEMPLTQVALTYMPHGAADLRATTSALEATAAAVHATFVPGPIWEQRWFGDPVHLNDQGAARWSADVAKAVSAALGA